MRPHGCLHSSLLPPPTRPVDAALPATPHASPLFHPAHTLVRVSSTSGNHALLNPSAFSPPPRCAPQHKCDLSPSSPNAFSSRNRCFQSFPPSSPSVNQAKSSCVQLSCLSTAAGLPQSKKWVCTEIAGLLSCTTDFPCVETAASLTRRSCDCRGTKASPEHCGSQLIRLTI